MTVRSDAAHLAAKLRSSLGKAAAEIVTRLEALEAVLGTDVAATAEAVANSIMGRDSNADTAVSKITASIFAGADAVTAPALAYFRGGKPSTANHGKEPTNNMVWDLGFGAQSTNGESSQINVLHGDSDVSADADKGGAWIAGEIGWVDQYSYDPAPSESDGASPPGTRLWRENTPRYLRVHVGTNPITEKGIGIQFKSIGDYVDFEAATYVQRTGTARGAFMIDGWSKVGETTQGVSGDGIGGYHMRHNRRMQTVGAVSKPLFKGGTEIVASSEFAHVECTLIEHTAGGTREIYRFSFGWLGAYGDDPSSVVADFHIVSNRYKDMTGKVAVSNDGAGNVTITVTGTAAETTIWTLVMDVIKEIPAPL